VRRQPALDDLPLDERPGFRLDDGFRRQRNDQREHYSRDRSHRERDDS
jgi:hypothetical protein